MQNRRKFSRLDFSAKSALIIKSAHFPTNLIDISMKGALVENPPNWTEKSGNKCDLVITLENSDITIVMEMEIAHVDKASIGLRCLSIDLESMTHLRRLLELNLGDPNLIERELVLLGR